MIIKEYSMTLDTKRGVMESPIVLVMGDTGNVFHLRIRDDGNDIDLSAARVLVAFHGPAGSYDQHDPIVDGATVSFTLDKQAVSEGTNSCDVQIYTGEDYGTLTTSAAFTFEVRAATVGEDTIRQDTSLPILVDLIRQVHQLETDFPRIAVEEIEGGHRITITNYEEEVVTCDVMDGTSGVYVGSGEMPEGFNVQIDPEGVASPGYMPEPGTEGSSGQVLKTDGHGGRYWDNITGNVYTNEEKTKLAGIEAGAQVNPEIVDALNSTAANKTLSAAQGKILRDMLPASGGTLDQVIRSNGDGTSRWDNAATQEEIGTAVTDWLDDHVPAGETLVVDTSLSVAGAAAEAKTTGGKLTEHENHLATMTDSIESGYDRTVGDKLLVFKRGIYRTASSPSVGAVVSYYYSESYACAICPCSEGDVFVANIKGATGAYRAWFFVDEDMEVVTNGWASANLHVADEEIVAPAGAAFACLNNDYNSDLKEGIYAFKKGTNMKVTVEAVKTVAELEKYTKPMDGTWTRYGAKELNGMYAGSSAEGNMRFSVNVANTYRYAFVYMKADDSTAGSTGWITDTEYIINPDAYPGTKKIKVRLQGYGGTESIPDTAYKAVSLCCTYPIVKAVESGSSSGKKAYVDGENGLDTNEGRTRATAFKTIQKAVNEGAVDIYVREGEYAEALNMEGLSGVSIQVDRYYDTYEAGTDEDDPKVVIKGESTRNTGVNIRYCNDISLTGIEVKDCTKYGFRVRNSTGIKMLDCVAHDIINPDPVAYVMGFAFDSADADLYGCLVYNIGVTGPGTGDVHSDGFNIHTTGTVNLFNCSGYNCEDDGVSHHDACCGVIDGGEWSYCGKAGVASPTHGAKVNVQNVYSHHNRRYGLYAGNDAAVTDRGNILVSNCVFVENTEKDIFADDYYSLILINCVYDSASGTHITPYGR